DVAAPPPVLQQVEMEERLATNVEDAGALFLDSGPAAHFREHVAQVVEELEGAVGHRLALTSCGRHPVCVGPAPPPRRPPTCLRGSRKARNRSGTTRSRPAR